VSEDFKAKVKTIFHHLTKDELVDKILANYLAQSGTVNLKPKASKKK
jgi:ATP-dependent RNA helicase DeaD